MEEELSEMHEINDVMDFLSEIQNKNSVIYILREWNEARANIRNVTWW